jgi:hypothetical protein
MVAGRGEVGTYVFVKVLDGGVVEGDPAAGGAARSWLALLHSHQLAPFSLSVCGLLQSHTLMKE